MHKKRSHSLHEVSVALKLLVFNEVVILLSSEGPGSEALISTIRLKLNEDGVQMVYCIVISNCVFPTKSKELPI